MGNSNRYPNTADFREEWSIIDLPYRHYSYPTLVQSETQGFLGELYQVRINKSSFLEREMRLNNLRQSSRSGFLPNIMGCYCGESRFQSSNLLQVITQRIPYKFSQILQLSSEEAIYLAYGIICGFSQLFLHLQQIFQIKEENIGINYFGVPKIWHRPNFAYNQPNFPQPSFFKNQNELIDSVLRMIEIRIAHYSQIPSCFYHLKRSQTKNINTALGILTQQKDKLDISNIRKNLMIRLFRLNPPIEKIPKYVFDSFSIENKSSTPYLPQHLLTSQIQKNLLPSQSQKNLHPVQTYQKQNIKMSASMVIGNIDQRLSPPKYRKSLEVPTVIKRINHTYSTPGQNKEKNMKKLPRRYEREKRNVQSLQQISLLRRRPESSTGQYPSLSRNRSGNIFESNMNVEMRRSSILY